jgi:hypothetical protein
MYTVRLISSEIASPHMPESVLPVRAVISVFILLALRDKFMQSSSVFWDITPCSPLKVIWRFGGTYRRHIQDRRISHTRNQHEAGGNLCSFPLKLQLTFNGLHGIMSQKIELFITTAVRTSDPTRHYVPEDRTLHNHSCENLRSYTTLYPRR